MHADPAGGGQLGPGVIAGELRGIVAGVIDLVRAR